MVSRKPNSSGGEQSEKSLKGGREREAYYGGRGRGDC